MRIDICSVLRHSANLPYTDLVTRSTGAAVRKGIERELEAMGEGDVATLDFTHIGMMDYSCADEVVAKLLLDVGSQSLRPAYIVFHGITDAHLEAIENVLVHHGLALVVYFADGGARLVGAVTDDERLIWELVQGRGAIGADDLATVSDRRSEDLAGILETLLTRRLLRRDGTAYAPLPGVN